MRLSTIDSNLAGRISRAKGGVLRGAAIAACKVAVARIKPTETLIFSILQAMENGEEVLPEQVQKLGKLAQNLDEIYFELSKSGKSNAALNAFSKARLYTAIQLALYADQPNEVAECIYEAGISLDGPDDVLDAASVALSNS